MENEQQQSGNEFIQNYMQEYRIKSGTCLNCCWAQVYEGLIYCPSAQGTCMRREFHRACTERKDENT